MLIYDNLKIFAETQSDKKCIINGSRQLTYLELACTVDNIAFRLAGLVNKGDKVLVKSSDVVKQLCYLLGIAKLAAAAVLIDPLIPDIIYEDIKNKSAAVLCIDDNFCLPETIAPYMTEVNPKDLFLGALSSGSTGEHKLIWRDHQSWVSAFPVQSRVFGLSGADTLFLCGSLVYTANLNSCLHLLYEGGTVVVAANTFPQTWLKDIVQHQVSAIFMVPAHYRALLKIVESPLTQIKSLVSAGAKIDIDTVKDLLECFPQAKLYEYYGASELGHVSYCSGEDLLKYPDTVGRAFPGVKLTLEDNLVWAESPYLAPAYRPKATVGDLGGIDPAGYLYLLGRENHLVNKGGVKISPERVEQILNRCPGVAEAAVKGVDDKIRGQKLAAWIVKSNPDLTAKEIKAFCRENLPRQFCPQKICFIDNLPRNNTGKLNREMLVQKDSH